MNKAYLQNEKVMVWQHCLFLKRNREHKQKFPLYSLRENPNTISQNRSTATKLLLTS